MAILFKVKACGLGRTAHGKKGILQPTIKTFSEIKMFRERLSRSWHNNKWVQSMSFTMLRTPYAIHLGHKTLCRTHFSITGQTNSFS